AFMGKADLEGVAGPFEFAQFPGVVAGTFGPVVPGPVVKPEGAVGKLQFRRVVLPEILGAEIKPGLWACGASGSHGALAGEGSRFAVPDDLGVLIAELHE